MSLQTNLSAAFTQIGTDIKGINTRLTSLESFANASEQSSSLPHPPSWHT
jgi:hypothetical protein